jgi:hypothetical protein
MCNVSDISCSLWGAVQDVHGRTFGVWTLLTCLLCVMTALNLDNEALYLVTFLSFVFALGYFLLECFVYHTMAVKSLASLFFFAGSLGFLPKLKAYILFFHFLADFRKPLLPYVSYDGYITKI